MIRHGIGRCHYVRHGRRLALRPADESVALFLRHCGGQRNTAADRRICRRSKRCEHAAVCIICKFGILAPHRKQSHYGITHGVAVARLIFGSRRVGRSRPAEESVVLPCRHRAAQRDYLVNMDLHCGRRTLAAVCVICHGVLVFLEPCGIEIRRLALLCDKSRRVGSVCRIHRPVLLIIDVPADKFVVGICYPRIFRRRQIEVTVSNIVNILNILAAAV